MGESRRCILRWCRGCKNGPRGIRVVCLWDRLRVGKQSRRGMQASRSSCFCVRDDGRHCVVPEGSDKGHWACALGCIEMVRMGSEVDILLAVHIGSTMEVHVGPSALAVRGLLDGYLGK